MFPPGPKDRPVGFFIPPINPAVNSFSRYQLSCGIVCPSSGASKVRKKSGNKEKSDLLWFMIPDYENDVQNRKI